MPSFTLPEAEGSRGMMRDRVRTEFYHQAISERVKPGDVVLDFGAGSGILSIFAAKAGARKVYAVERTSIAEIAREIIQHNGLTTRIELVCGDIETVNFPNK
jgi:predicted RNA methylase